MQSIVCNGATGKKRPLGGDILPKIASKIKMLVYTAIKTILYKAKRFFVFLFEILCICLFLCVLSLSSFFKYIIKS